MGLEMGMSYYVWLLADVEADLGEHATALARVDGMLTRARASGERYYLGELLRLRARCLLALGGPDAKAQAEASLREAAGLAREQGSRMVELRAHVALSELLRERGQAAEAREQLAGVLGGFTEGLDTPELVQARALLGALGS
jgi:predicted ATPase